MSFLSQNHISGRDHRLAYGLHIESEFPLPELLPLPVERLTETPDVCIEVGPTLSHEQVQEMMTVGAPLENVMRFSDNECRVLFSEVARISVENGNSMRVEPCEGRTEVAWRLPALGTMLSLLLEQRGLFTLHAGAVQMPGPDGPVACAFAGEKGQGKSTLNAALSLAGFPLLCDDVLALQMDTSPLLALVGFGSIKLVPDAVESLLRCSPDALPLVAPELVDVAAMNKRHFETSLAQEPLPLKHVFLLNSHDDAARDDIELRLLSPQDGLAQLLPHTFGVRWGALYITGQRSATHLKACAKTVTQCHVWELSRRRDLTLLPRTIELIAQTVLGSS